MEAVGLVIGRGGENIKGLRAIPDIKSVKLSDGKGLNAPHMLVARGAPGALEIVRENITDCLTTAFRTISNQSRQHHTHDLVSGRFLTPADVHPELSKAKRKHKPGSMSEKRGRDKGRKEKEAAREARLGEERGGGLQPRAWGRMEQAEHLIQARQLEASRMYSASLLGDPLADDVFVNQQVCKRLEWKGGANFILACSLPASMCTDYEQLGSGVQQRMMDAFRVPDDGEHMFDTTALHVSFGRFKVRDQAALGRIVGCISKFREQIAAAGTNVKVYPQRFHYHYGYVAVAVECEEELVAAMHTLFADEGCHYSRETPHMTIATIPKAARSRMQDAELDVGGTVIDIPLSNLCLLASDPLRVDRSRGNEIQRKKEPGGDDVYLELHPPG